jgi:hypothetical protein
VRDLSRAHLRFKGSLVTRPRTLARALLLAAVASTCVSALALPAFGSPPRSPNEATTLARARLIRDELNARYRSLPGRTLVVTEASSTKVVESFTLLSSDLREQRTVAAWNGVWFALCPARATCPYPAPRDGRPAAAYLPRQLALELAIRTFLETSASVVAVSLPTPHHFTVFVIQRTDLMCDPDLLALARAARSARMSAWPRPTVDRTTRPRIFVFVGMEPTPTGRESFAAIPRWPDPSGEG